MNYNEYENLYLNENDAAGNARNETLPYDNENWAKEWIEECCCEKEAKAEETKAIERGHAFGA